MIFDRIPWNMNIWVLPVEADRTVTPVSFFAKLLSDGFFAERHIDAFAAHLNVQARKKNPSAPGFLVATLSFSNTLSRHHNTSIYVIRGCKLLSQYAAVFRSNKATYHILLIPAHVGDARAGHWVVFQVDFRKREYSYGELRIGEHEKLDH